MEDQPAVAEIVDRPEVKKLVLRCGCAAILQVVDEQPATERTATKGASFYFCAEHVNPELDDEAVVAVVYDVKIEKIEDPFAWDYKVYPGL